MWQANPTRLAKEISSHFGLHLGGELGKTPAGDTRILLAPLGVHPNEAFQIQIEVGWRSLKAEFVPGTFAGPLIAQMGMTDSGGRTVFSGIAQKCASENGRIEMVVNGHSVSPQDADGWPPTWQSLRLVLQKTPLAINTEDHAENERLLSLWTKRFAGLVLSLTPLEEDGGQTEINPEGLLEGGSVRVLVNRYERKYTNRINCLAVLGYSCMACGFNFEQTYGDIGEGFIHVHHLTPVSQMGEGYVVDPTRDLVPLCPNCHAMAHTSSPPLSVDQLKQILSRHTSQN